MSTTNAPDDRRIPLPPRRFMATMQSVRAAAARHGVDAENECRSHGIAEWSHDLAWLEMAKEKFGISEAEEARLTHAFRERNQAIWGAYLDAGEL